MTLRYINRIILASVAVVVFVSCEDIVEVDLDQGKSQLVVDAFLNDKDLPSVKLIQSQDFFDNSELDFVTDAEVTITGGSESYELELSGNEYTFSSVINFEVEEEYVLNIQIGEDIYTSSCTANPVPPIDTIQYEFVDGFGDNEGGYFAEFISFDIAGREDYYWVKYSRNGELANDPSEIIVSQDAAFSGNGADGLLFIPPIRAGINDFDSAFLVGDELEVQLLSIDNHIYNFLIEVGDQATNEGITATPSFNLRSNITHISGPDELGAIGNFCVSKVSSYETTIEE